MLIKYGSVMEKKEKGINAGKILTHQKFLLRHGGKGGKLLVIVPLNYVTSRRY